MVVELKRRVVKKHFFLQNIAFFAGYFFKGKDSTSFLIFPFLS